MEEKTGCSLSYRNTPPYICKQKSDKDVQNGIPASRDYNVPLLAWRTISEEA